jgi:hypothetical protein
LRRRAGLLSRQEAAIHAYPLFSDGDGFPQTQTKLWETE